MRTWIASCVLGKRSYLTGISPEVLPANSTRTRDEHGA